MSDKKMILEEETFEAFEHYPKDLMRKSNKPILAACDNCGKVRETSKGNYHALCNSCANKGKNLGKYCGANNPNWKGGKVKRICQGCGIEFLARPGDIKNGNGKYCSLSCASTVNIKKQRHNARPAMTVPEMAFKAVCEKYILPFKFAGDGALWLGNANPDFVHNTKKIVVEVFGDYWHSPLLGFNPKYNHTLKGRSKQLKAEGYKLIVLWESDLKRKDAEAFVMHLMQKEKVI